MTEDNNGKKKGRICIDFDGVLNTYNGWKGEDFLHRPHKQTRRFLESLSANYSVYILTSRRIRDVKHWLYLYGFEDLVKDVVNEKIPAIAYIDDRAIRYDGSVDDVLSELDGFKAHWEEE